MILKKNQKQYHKDLRYCLRTPVYVFDVNFQNQSIQLCLEDKQCGNVYGRMFEKQDLKGIGMIDALDLMLVFLPKEQAKVIFEHGKGKEKIERNLQNSVNFDFDQQHINGNNSFTVMKDGRILITHKFFKIGNIQRMHELTFTLTLQKQSQKNVLKAQNLEQRNLQNFSFVRIETFQQTINQLKKQTNKKIQNLQQKLTKLIQKKQEKIDYNKAKQKYIDDLCD